MKLQLAEHELEQAIEVFLSSFVNQPVTVHSFDLSGMRSKDGLTAMVDFSIVGVTDVRQPVENSVNVNPTNTKWREEVSQEPVEIKQLPPEYFDVLELLSDNPLNKNRSKIEQILSDNPELEADLIQVGLYQAWVNQCQKDNISAVSLDQEESEMDNLVLRSDDTENVSSLETMEETTEEPEDKAVPELVVSTEPKQVIPDEPKTEQPKVKREPLFGSQLKQTNVEVSSIFK